ncbi:class I mannose-6-phosphate isomerase [uncultured Erythrobacter sp.]|uniref:class I mannose-6-phosphate isomerase n=1 Tax=uncultured Erythrobacter sp. TaxID=263913 RepID=UPI00260F40CE|nr:class I mannose-6-phosphate isomerase [uncultured Erythrobacter sp.]
MAGAASGSTTEPFVRKLPKRMVEKVWGREDLPAPFTAPDGQRIGEIWFEPPPEQNDLLVKYLFTSEKLSVQVHPGEDNTLEGEDSKEECWLVLDAEPGAQLAIGFDAEITPEAIGAAAKDGSIKELLTWHDVKAGDVFHLTPGTVHAIGAGLTLVEVQQNSDTTFRLYDYGRPRELHLERALAVALGEPYPADLSGTVEERGETLIDAKRFRLDRVEGVPGPAMEAAYPGTLQVLPLKGVVKSKLGEVVAEEGECLVASGLDELDFSRAQITLLTRSV